MTEPCPERVKDAPHLKEHVSKVTLPSTEASAPPLEALQPVKLTPTMRVWETSREQYADTHATVDKAATAPPTPDDALQLANELVCREDRVGGRNWVRGEG